MTRFLQFPGVTGSYVSTDDVNLLDADTAHLFQSIDTWENIGAPDVLTQVDMPESFSGKALRAVPEGGDAQMYQQSTIQVPVTAGQTVTMTIRMKATSLDGFSRARFAPRWDDNTFGAVDFTDIDLGQPTFDTVQSQTVVVPAGRTTIRIAMDIVASTVNAASSLEFSDAMVAIGTLPVFIPSLNIVGTLFEEFNSTPDDPPIVYAADGTPLTVGDNWEGDLFTYSRHDGADASAPIVARFDAEDIPI